jgi:hypothetical protein
MGYSRFLTDVLEDVRHDRHLDAVDLDGGDPLAIVEAARRKMAERERIRGDYFVRAVFLDSDKLGACPDRDRQIEPLAALVGITLVWEEPCFEALLLRHLPGFQASRPVNAIASKAALLVPWPTYVKPMPAYKLRSRIDINDVQRVRRVELVLDAFLRAVGFPDE